MGPRVLSILLVPAVMCASVSYADSKGDKVEHRQLVFLKNGRVLCGRVAWEDEKTLQLDTKSCKVMVTKADIVKIEHIRVAVVKPEPKAPVPKPDKREIVAPAAVKRPGGGSPAEPKSATSGALGMVSGLIKSLRRGSVEKAHVAPEKKEAGVREPATSEPGARWVKFVSDKPDHEKLGCGVTIVKDAPDGGRVVEISRAECNPKGELRVRRRAVYKLNDKGRLESVDKEIATARMTFKVECRVAGDKLKWRRIGPGPGEKSGAEEWRGDTLPVNLVVDELLGRGVVKPGLRTSVPILEPMSQKTGMAEVTVKPGAKPGLVLVSVVSKFRKSPDVEEQTIVRTQGPDAKPEIVGWMNSQTPGIRAVVTTHEDAVAGVATGFKQPRAETTSMDVTPDGR